MPKLSVVKKTSTVTKFLSTFVLNASVVIMMKVKVDTNIDIYNHVAL